MTLFMNLLCSLLMVALLILDASVLAQSDLSQSQKQEICATHNLFRSTVVPQASNMLRMLWNNELARVAQNHANRCIFEYNQNRASQAPSFATVGENLFVTSAQTVNYTAAVKAWYDEVMYYDYNLNSCSGAIMCRNYIQVVWAHTNMIGCGVTRCATLQNFLAPNSSLLVCNYGPERNDDERPYRNGVPCSQCPENTTSCDDNLCRNNMIIGPPIIPMSGTTEPSVSPPTTQPTTQPTSQTVQATTDSDNDMATTPTAPVIDEDTGEESQVGTSSRSRVRSRSRKRTRARTRVPVDDEETTEESQIGTSSRSRVRSRARTRTRARTRAPVDDEETAEESQIGTSSRSRVRSRARTRTRSKTGMSLRSRNRIPGSSRSGRKTGKKKGSRER